MVKAHATLSIFLLTCDICLCLGNVLCYSYYEYLLTGKQHYEIGPCISLLLFINFFNSPNLFIHFTPKHVRSILSYPFIQFSQTCLINSILPVHSILPNLFIQFHPTCTFNSLLPVHSILPNLFNQFHPTCTFNSLLPVHSILPAGPLAQSADCQSDVAGLGTPVVSEPVRSPSAE